MYYVNVNVSRQHVLTFKKKFTSFELIHEFDFSVCCPWGLWMCPGHFCTCFVSLSKQEEYLAQGSLLWEKSWDKVKINIEISNMHEYFVMILYTCTSWSRVTLNSFSKTGCSVHVYCLNVNSNSSMRGWKSDVSFD